MRVSVVNGIRTHGKGNVDRLLPRLEARGLEVQDIRLPKRSSISARWGGRKDGRTIAKLTEDGEILVAHSFGAVRAAFAMELRTYAHVFMVAPAHSRHYQFRDPGRVTCFHSKGDWVVELGSWLPLSPFGKAGTLGYSQPGITNIGVSSDHDDYFEEPLITRIVDRVCLVAGME